MTPAEITAKVQDGAEIIRDRIRADVQTFAIPVRYEPREWSRWLADQCRQMGFTAMAEEAAPAHNRKLAQVVAFETLYRLGGYETPFLCIPEVLDRDQQLTYWRAVAIIAESSKREA